MKTALLPLALVALTLPGAALAYPVKVVYKTNAAQPVVPGYPSYGAVPYYTPAPQAVATPVVRYRVRQSYGTAPVAAPYGYTAPPTYSYGTPAGYGAPAPYGVATGYAPAPRTCVPSAGRALIGAAMGGLASVALAPRAQDRRWAVPVGAAIGGLGGLAIGC